jgi:hypothetical protein
MLYDPKKLRGLGVEIDILGKKYSVEKRRFLARDDNCAGRHNAALCKIEIDGTSAQNMAGSILIHEILEAINYHMELGLDHPNITRLESGLFQIMKANGGADWLDMILDRAKLVD